MISNNKGIKELKSLTMDPTVIMVLIPKNLEVREMLSDTIESI